MTNFTNAIADFLRGIARAATANTQVAMYAAYLVTGLTLYVMIFAAPSGFVQAPMVLLPALVGIMVMFARSLDCARDRMWALVGAMPFGVGATALYLWAAIDATTSRLTNWVAAGDKFTLTPATVSVQYIGLAVLAVLVTLALVRPTFFAYHESRPQPKASRA